ncbi:gas vesicle protein GvpG [Candidatus Cyanaurora vandensis]|uniref:gas vesicle protein GvpG n=1 Tax=Candidatus Cyanaurora vandensis TaxID=2714958 RepID=UPI0025797CBF|nr:gas vesicle protein GvpG [Candidatus Cyanaurora vandensis]
MIWQLLTWPVSGLMWIAEEILETAEVDTDDKSRLQRELTAIQIAFDLGDITEEDFLEQEEVILDALEALEEQSAN